MVSSLLLESYLELNRRDKCMVICILTFLPTSAPPVRSVCFRQDFCIQFLPSRIFIGTICYDDACHLLKYATNTARRTLTPTAKRMAGMSYVVDRMHFKGHVDPWCRYNCDPDKLPVMERVHAYVYNC